MNGFNFIADTNFLIKVHEGKPETEPFLDGLVVVSVISEIELLGEPSIVINKFIKNALLRKKEK